MGCCCFLMYVGICLLNSILESIAGSGKWGNCLFLHLCTTKCEFYLCWFQVGEKIPRLALKQLALSVFVNAVNPCLFAAWTLQILFSLHEKELLNCYPKVTELTRRWRAHKLDWHCHLYLCHSANEQYSGSRQKQLASLRRGWKTVMRNEEAIDPSLSSPVNSSPAEKKA